MHELSTEDTLPPSADTTDLLEGGLTDPERDSREDDETDPAELGGPPDDQLDPDAPLPVGLTPAGQYARPPFGIAADDSEETYLRVVAGAHEQSLAVYYRARNLVRALHKAEQGHFDASTLLLHARVLLGHADPENFYLDPDLRAVLGQLGQDVSRLADGTVAATPTTIGQLIHRALLVQPLAFARALEMAEAHHGAHALEREEGGAS